MVRVLLALVLAAPLLAPGSAWASAATAPATPAPKRPKIAVLQITASKGADGKPSFADAVLDAITSVVQIQVEKLGYYDVVSRSDIEAALGVEATKMKLGGCNDDSSCVAEIAGALGVEKVLYGRLNRISAQSVVIDLVILNAKSSARMGHVVKTHQGSVDALVGAAKAATDELIKQHVDFVSGYLEVKTSKPGVPVSVEGQSLGVTPVTANLDQRLREGKRIVTLRSAVKGDIKQEVEIKVGQVAMLYVSLDTLEHEVKYREAKKPAAPPGVTAALPPNPDPNLAAAPPPAAAPTTPEGDPLYKWRLTRNIGLGVGVAGLAAGFISVAAFNPDAKDTSTGNVIAANMIFVGFGLGGAGLIAGSVGFCGSLGVFGGGGGDGVTVSPAAAPTNGGAVVGFTGRF